jgi:glutamate--cysteine ligase
VLQLENEFYSAIRLKGRVRKGESHLDAMQRDGVEYAEVRILDNNPLATHGIALDTLRFLQVLLLDALLADETGAPAAESDLVQENHHRVALAGRQPGLTLFSPDGEKPLPQLARPIFSRLLPLARLMDRGLPQPVFADAVRHAWRQLVDPSLLPSAQIHRAMARARLSHHAYGVQLLKPSTALACAA